MDNHKITARFDSGLSFISTIDQHSLTMDASAISSEGLGPSPKKLMLAALAGCTGIDVVSILEKMKANARFATSVSTNTIDGVRVEYTDGFGLARPSNTTPVVVMRFEADSAAAIARIQAEFKVALLAAKPDAKLPF